MSRSLRGLFVLWLGAAPIACVGLSTQTGSVRQGLYGDFEDDVNRLGQDYASFELEAPDPQLCQTACEKDVKCRAFTYVKPGYQGPPARCWLKHTIPQGSPHDCCVSGAKP